MSILVRVLCLGHLQLGMLEASFLSERWEKQNAVWENSLLHEPGGREQFFHCRSDEIEVKGNFVNGLH
jgi:hypothetical protein